MWRARAVNKLPAEDVHIEHRPLQKWKSTAVRIYLSEIGALNAWLVEV